MKDQNAVALGRKGGKSMSMRKLEAIKENLRLARLKRWPIATPATEPVVGMRYLIAKYISYLTRNEPKNIGVVLASDSGVIAKFIGEKEGRIDSRVVRPLVSHTGTYKQWIEYWRHVITQDAESDEKLDRVIASSRGNYVVVEGEVVYLPPEIAADPYATLRQLYYLLIEEFPEDLEKEGELDLNAKCDEIIRQYDLKKNPTGVGICCNALPKGDCDAAE